MTSPGGRIGFADYYRSRRNAVLFRWIDWRKLSIIRRELATLPPEAIVLDLGSGSGGIPAGLGQDGRPRVVCVERDAQLAGLCRRRGLDVVRADVEATLPIASASADAVLMIDAIEHVEEPPRVLAEIHRIARPGAVIVLFTPPYDSVRWLLAERFHNTVTGRPSDHIAPFTAESFAYHVSRFFPGARFGRTNFNLSMYAVAVRPGAAAAGAAAAR